MTKPSGYYYDVEKKKKWSWITNGMTSLIRWWTTARMDWRSTKTGLGRPRKTTAASWKKRPGRAKTVSEMRVRENGEGRLGGRCHILHVVVVWPSTSRRALHDGSSYLSERFETANRSFRCYQMWRIHVMHAVVVGLLTTRPREEGFVGQMGEQQIGGGGGLRMLTRESSWYFGTRVEVIPLVLNQSRMSYNVFPSGRNCFPKRPPKSILSPVCSNTLISTFFFFFQSKVPCRRVNQFYFQRGVESNLHDQLLACDFRAYNAILVASLTNYTPPPKADPRTTFCILEVWVSQPQKG